MVDDLSLLYMVSHLQEATLEFFTWWSQDFQKAAEEGKPQSASIAFIFFLDHIFDYHWKKANPLAKLGVAGRGGIALNVFVELN